MSWCATEFEFRHRFWIISGIFYLGFSCYIWTTSNVCVAVVRMILADCIRRWRGARFGRFSRRAS